MLTPERLRRLPKAELHVHLDGSLRPATLLDLARLARVPLPASDPDSLRRYMLVDDARNLEDYLRRFDLTVAVLQAPEAIERVAYEMVEDAAADGVRYLEVRYCPSLSTKGGLTLREVFEAQLRGLHRGGQDFGVRSGVIACSLRHFDPAKSVQIARATVELRGRGVVGFDLAGGEAGHPPSAHAEAFDIAARGYLGITVHAGEGAGAESIAEAVHRCHAERIGHGTRLFEDPALRDYLRDRRILVETNLTSNVQTRVVGRVAEHPARGYYEAGVAVTLCTDNWLMSGVTLSGEYWLAHTELGFTAREIRELILNGFRGAFLPWPEKQQMLAAVTDELSTLR
jgi:adenosine deaminase